MEQSESVEQPTAEIDMSTDSAESVDDLWTSDEPEGGSETQNPSWFLDEDVPGKGDRPDWLKDKYKTVSDQAKAYIEAEKMIGEHEGAPKDGYNLEEIGQFDPKDPMLNHFAETFKDLNLPQKSFERVINEFVDAQQAAMIATSNEEFKRMGLEGKQQIKQIDNWLNNTFNADVAKTIKSWVGTKEDIQALTALRSLQRRENIPDGFSNNDVHYETVSELENEKMNNWSKYKTDEKYRGDWKRRYDGAHSRSKNLKRAK